MSDVILCTPYTYSETTRCAIQLAELLQNLGCSVRLATYEPPRATFGGPWDSRVYRLDLETLSWCGRSVFVWIRPPPPGVLDDFCDVGRSNVLVLGRESSWYYDFAAVEHFVCLNPTIRRDLLSQLPAAAARLIPWSVGGPPLSAESGPERTCLLPLHDDYARQVHPKYLQLAAIQAGNSGYRLRVTCRPGQAGKVRSRLRRINGQLQADVCEVADDLQERTAFLGVDLTLWPADYDAFGRVPQLAGYAASPLVSWDYPPVSQLVQAGKTGALVPRGRKLESSDHRRLWSEFAVLSTPGYDLTHLRQPNHAYLQEHHRQFERNWTDLMEVVL